MEPLLGQPTPEFFSLMTAAAAQVPSLVVVVVLVIRFLQHLSKDADRQNLRDDRMEDFCDAQTAAMKTLADDYKIVLRENSAAIRENSQALGKVNK